MKFIITLIGFCAFTLATIAQPTWRVLDNAPSGGRFDDIFFF